MTAARSRRSGTLCVNSFFTQLSALKPFLGSLRKFAYLRQMQLALSAS
jgi:hypothetical protein